MTIMLLGRWDHDGNLTIEESHETEPGDQTAIDALVQGQDDPDGMAWAASFETDTHKQAVTEAYEVYVRDAGVLLVDEVGGVVTTAPPD